jgi:hypothetical protein
MTKRFGGFWCFAARWCWIAMLAGCGRSTSSDAGAKSDASPEVAADRPGDVSIPQNDVMAQDQSNDLRIGVFDERPPSLDAAIDGAIDLDAEPVGLTEAGASLDGAPLDSSTDVWPTPLPSRQSVHFTIESQRRGWAVISADRCGALSVERQNGDGSWQPLVLGIPYQCGCECPVPPDFAGLQSLSSPPKLTWDARELAVVSTILNCPTTPGHTQGMPMLRAFPQPVAAGHYRATAVVFDSLPVACTEQVETGWASCVDFSRSPYPFAPLTEYKACPGNRTAKAEFDLPASGDIDVVMLVN